MSEKKKPGRFTLQFNLEDPQQRTVSHLLEQQGRHKAQFLTSAVLHYIQQSEQKNSSSFTIDEQELEQVLMSILKKHPQIVKEISNESTTDKDIPSPAVPAVGSWETPVSDDAMLAISETLAAFQQQ